jgi:hypothetical protein
MYRFLPKAFFHWCNTTALAQAIGHSVWGIPILQTFHMIGLILLLGSIFVLNLTVLGVGLPEPASKLARQVAPWAATGLVLAIGTGVPMFMGAAESYGLSDVLLIKLILLASAIVIQSAIHLIPGMYSGTAYGKAFAVLSLFCWFGIAYAGRAIAFPNLIGG